MLSSATLGTWLQAGSETCDLQTFRQEKDCALLFFHEGVRRHLHFLVPSQDSDHFDWQQALQRHYCNTVTTWVTIGLMLEPPSKLLTQARALGTTCGRQFRLRVLTTSSQACEIFHQTQHWPEIIHEESWMRNHDYPFRDTLSGRRLEVVTRRPLRATECQLSHKRALSEIVWTLDTNALFQPPGCCATAQSQVLRQRASPLDGMPVGWQQPVCRQPGLTLMSHSAKRTPA